MLVEAERYRCRLDGMFSRLGLVAQAPPNLRSSRQWKMIRARVVIPAIKALCFVGLTRFSEGTIQGRTLCKPLTYKNNDGWVWCFLVEH